MMREHEHLKYWVIFDEKAMVDLTLTMECSKCPVVTASVLMLCP